MALLSDFVRSYCRFQSIISRRPASAYVVSHLLLRSVPVPGDQVHIGARGISRVTAGGRGDRNFLWTSLDISLTK